MARLVQADLRTMDDKERVSGPSTTESGTHRAATCGSSTEEASDVTVMSSKDDKGWAAPEEMEEVGAWRGGGGLEKEGDEAQLDGETCLSDRRAMDNKKRGFGTVNNRRHRPPPLQLAVAAGMKPAT